MGLFLTLVAVIVFVITVVRIVLLFLLAIGHQRGEKNVLTKQQAQPGRIARFNGGSQWRRDIRVRECIGKGRIVS